MNKKMLTCFMLWLAMLASEAAYCDELAGLYGNGMAANEKQRAINRLLYQFGLAQPLTVRVARSLDDLKQVRVDVGNRNMAAMFAKSAGDLGRSAKLATTCSPLALSGLVDAQSAQRAGGIGCIVLSIDHATELSDKPSIEREWDKKELAALNGGVLSGRAYRLDDRNATYHEIGHAIVYGDLYYRGIDLRDQTRIKAEQMEVGLVSARDLWLSEIIADALGFYLFNHLESDRLPFGDLIRYREVATANYASILRTPTALSDEHDTAGALRAIAKGYSDTDLLGMSPENFYRMALRRAGKYADGQMDRLSKFRDPQLIQRYTGNIGGAVSSYRAEIAERGFDTVTASLMQALLNLEQTKQLAERDVDGYLAVLRADYRRNNGLVRQGVVFPVDIMVAAMWR